MTAMARDLEGFQRAFRLRSSADDGLLRQIFGEEDALENLQRTNPFMLETARMYLPHLASSTYDRLVKEPDALQVERARCDREMEQLALQNYGAFIGSAKVTQSVRQELSGIQKQLDALVEGMGPAQDAVRAFAASAADLSRRRSALRAVKEQQGQILELLEIPQLLDACIRNQLYDESLELLAYCGTLLQAHTARGEHIPVLDELREQVAGQRASLHRSLLAQLKTDIHLPACVRIIGFLRRLQKHSEEELRRLFIEHRAQFLESHKHQVELLRGSRGSAVTALRNAADLLRTHVYDIGTQYRALFPADEAPLAAFLSEQIVWLTSLLHAHVQPPVTSSQQQGSALGSTSRGAGGAAGSAVIMPAFARMDAAALTTVLRHFLHASSTLKRLGGHFFPSVAVVFEARMEFHLGEMLDLALLTFHAELGRYDWVPSTALSTRGACGGASGSGASGGGDAAETSAVSWLHPQALELTRHRPLAVFANDFVQMFNELRQCALYGLRVPVVSRSRACLMEALSMLRSIKGCQTFPQGSPKASELARFAQHFAHIFVPLIASHLEAIFGDAAVLDVSGIIASMVPDLLAAPEEPMLLEEEPVVVADASAPPAAAEPPPAVPEMADP